MDEYDDDEPAGDSCLAPDEYDPAPAAEAAARAAHIDDYPADLLMPWDEEPPDEPRDPAAPRVRHDAFTPRRRNQFLKAFARLGCLADACREIGVSPRTVYNRQSDDSEFVRLCALAASTSATPVELTAWERGVVGVEERFACGGKVETRMRRSDHILKLLLQGSNPKKYGARPGFGRKRILKRERKEMRREIEAELKARDTWSFDEAITALGGKLDALDARQAHKRLEAGWTRNEDGHWIPPGWGPTGSAAASLLSPAGGDDAGGAEGAEGDGRGDTAPRDSM